VESLSLPDGRVLAYREAGEGRPTLCHPGGPCFSSYYLEDIAATLPGRRLIFLDPRGTGASDPPVDGDSYRLQDYAADVDALRRHLDLDVCDFVGHSHGSLVGLVYAADRPDRVDEMLLIATGTRFSAEQLAAMEAAMERRSGEPWFDDASAALAAEDAGDFGDDRELGRLVARELPFYFARYGESERAFVARLRDTRVHGAALRCWNADEFRAFDLRPALGRIRARTLIVVGTEDFILGPAAAAEVANGVPDADLVEVPGVGHYPWIEDPQAFEAAVASFRPQPPAPG
jgi:pimeloyl-ACP methyl ester carboxylesterase